MERRGGERSLKVKYVLEGILYGRDGDLFITIPSVSIKPFLPLARRRRESERH